MATLEDSEVPVSDVNLPGVSAVVRLLPGGAMDELFSTASLYILDC